jgi:hydroxyethylthiazole kinase-like uncharacterized protein yjeF
MTQDGQHIPEFRITADQLVMLRKTGARHKYDYGHAVIVSGPPGQGGAARLAARGALRIGAGVVSVFTSLDCQAEHAAHLNAIMVKTYNDTKSFGGQLSALRPSAICIGPNLGVCDKSRTKLLEVLTLPSPLCLDADAITLIAQEPDLMKSVVSAQVIMTPHEGELRRLIPASFTQTTCRVSLAKIAAKTMNCSVLFKGMDTIIARPDGDCTVVSSQNFEHAAWLATAGSGDVLSGIITGLLAKGFDAFGAAAIGANLHLQCADAIGPGLIADDIPEAIPDILKRYLDVEANSNRRS